MAAILSEGVLDQMVQSCSNMVKTTVLCKMTSSRTRFKHSLGYLDGTAIRNAYRGDSRESIRANRFAAKPLFSSCWSDSRESPQTSDSQFIVPEKAIRTKKGFSSGTLKTIRENQAIRANLRIDSRESGHLSLFWAILVHFGLKRSIWVRQPYWSHS